MPRRREPGVFGAFASIIRLHRTGWDMMSSLLSKLTPRFCYAAGFLVCAGLMAFALYLQHYEYQNPCPLCILQMLLLVIAVMGGSVAARHVWLQHLPKDRVPECGPGLEYMLNRFPLGQALEKIFRGSGECAEAGWTFIGVSIPEWSLLWLVLLGVYAIFIAAVISKPRTAA